jgi:probable HAF family extracellular repeat protein
MRHLYYRLAFIGLLVAAAGGAYAQAEFQMLTLPGGGSWASFSLSQDGSKMACNVGGGIYLWTRGTGYSFCGTGSPMSSSVGLSADGTTICADRFGTDGNNNPAIWTEAAGWTDLGHPTEGCIMDGSWGSGYAVSGDGSIAVGLAWYCPGAEGFRWTRAGGMAGLGHPDGSSSRASDVSADGSTIVGFYEHPETGGRRPVRWVGSGSSDLFAGTENGGEATGVSSDGSMITGQVQFGDNFHAFLYTDSGGLIDLRTVSGDNSDPSLGLAVSDDGAVVGVSGSPWWGVAEAFIWTSDAGIMSMAQYLTAAGATIPAGLLLTSAYDISADGKTIVGAWQDASWNQGCWMATITPNPTPVFLMEFSATPRDYAVDLAFRVGAQASPEDFELVGRLGRTEWSVSINQDRDLFSARDDASALRQGGEVTYNLFYLGDGGRDLVRSEAVKLDWTAPVTEIVGASPNPFAPRTTLSFSLAEAGPARVSVFDLAGRRVAVLADRAFEAGGHQVIWDGTGDGGRALPNGVYLVRLQGGDQVRQARVILVR